ncbi:MAG: TetR/AcrR family transcriptional regulator [Clostridia bacterium]|nr:TetR/AcrR family transcriptional regulator [Clostridia bacterium]
MKNPEHRVNTTKKLLREALMEMLKDKPLRSITVKEICGRAGLNRGTFYAHYSDVFDLMAQIEAEMEAGFLAALTPVLTDERMSPPRVTKKVFQCLEQNADLCRVTIGPNGDRAFAIRVIGKGREHCETSCRRLYPNADPRNIKTYFTFVTGGCIALMERWLREGMKDSSDVLAEAAERIMECGIRYLE